MGGWEASLLQGFSGFMSREALNKSKVILLPVQRDWFHTSSLAWYRASRENPEKPCTNPRLYCFQRDWFHTSSLN